MNAGDRVPVGRLMLDPIDLDEAADWVVRRSRSGTPSVVVTSNIQHLHLAEVDSGFCEAVERADLNVADGWPLVVAARLGGSRIQHVPGIDLVRRILGRGSGLRLAILGGREDASERLAQRLRRNHVVALVDPMRPGTWNSDRGVETLKSALARARPNLVLVGIGAPAREILAQRLRPSVSGPVVCCGAAVDVLSGCVRRAPTAMRICRLEWLYRMLREPRRLSARYARSFLTLVAVSIRKSRERAVRHA